MTIANWMADLQLLTPLQAQSQWRPMHLTSSSTLLSRDELNAWLAERGPVTGWLVTTGAATALMDQPVHLDTPLLEAELVAGTDHWLLRKGRNNQWQLAHHRLQPAAEGDANALAEAVSHRGRDNCRLHYWRIWQADEQGAPRCQLALLERITVKEAH